ncbi:MAG: hypothetical protein ACJAT4_003157 [Granulosicoccus sp.]|jgi:hypothetical protein
MKDKLYTTAIQWAERKGFKKIKANADEYETPKSFYKPSTDITVIPDITGVKMGAKSYIEIALKADNMKATISKWKLFGTLAAQKGGKLYLLAGRGHKSFVERIVQKHNLTNATVISI